MQTNNSSNHTLPLFSNSSEKFSCSDVTVSYIFYTIFITTSSPLLLLLYILVLWTGFQRWRQQKSSTTRTVTSHSEVFTLSLVMMEIVCMTGLVFYHLGLFNTVPRMMMVGYFCSTFSYTGQTLFQCLTCMEHYIAVCHHITYRALRKETGVKIRNMSIGVAWLFSFVVMVCTAFYYPEFPTGVAFGVLACTFVVIFFCSFSVLRGLVSLGLWKVGGGKEQLDQSKFRALQNTTAIVVTLMLKFSGMLVWILVFTFNSRRSAIVCVMHTFGLWLCLPSSMTLPLLYLNLHRPGTLACCTCALKKNGKQEKA